MRFLDPIADQGHVPAHAIVGPDHATVVPGLEIDELVLAVAPVLDLPHVPEIIRIVDLVRVRVLMIGVFAEDVESQHPGIDPFLDQDRNLVHR